MYMLDLCLSFLEVQLNQYVPEKIQKKLINRRIVKEVRSAYNNVPFYRKKYDRAGVDIKSIKGVSDLKKLPFLTKQDIMDNFPGDIVSDKEDINKCHCSATTGSTGKALSFVFNDKTLSYYINTSLRVYTMIGYKPWYKTVYIKYTKIDIPKFGPFFRFAHVPSTISVEEQIKLIGKENPDLLVGYASIIFEIAASVTAENLKNIRPKMISVNSELSTKHQRDFISSIFKCPVYDEYSTEETWMIAAQCRHHKYHLFVDNVWVEFLDKQGNEIRNGGSGEIVLTTTHSPAMPFIRYKIGDRGKACKDSCTCGNKLPMMLSFDGRADDSFILPSGKYVSSLKLLNTFTKYIKTYLNLIAEFKIVQEKKDLIVIYLVKGTQYMEIFFKQLISDLYNILGESVTIKIKYQAFIAKNGSIKRKAVESLVRQGNSAMGMDE